MFKYFKSLLLLTALTLVITGCNSDEEEGSTNDQNETDQEMTQPEEEQDSETEDESEKSMELQMGETAELKTTIGEFNLTLVNAKKEEEIEGEQSQLDTFVVTEWEVENASDEPMEIADMVSALDMYAGKDDTGRGWILLENQEAWEGTLEPGEKATGELLFELYNSDTYYAGMEYASNDSDLKSVMWKFSIE
ncbi:DUF4352 domain-containing protein [Thalassobacillus hwangdonensis]|uniref:DUF4352 domain-containing protein n=1 Tax=Thalassobacillus hwangdonensis TaxID=546108 RepID=A0ABW3KXQ9_9BACI